jgi:hypothetical protein
MARRTRAFPVHDSDFDYGYPLLVYIPRRHADTARAEDPIRAAPEPDRPSRTVHVEPILPYTPSGEAQAQLESKIIPCLQAAGVHRVTAPMGMGDDHSGNPIVISSRYDRPKARVDGIVTDLQAHRWVTASMRLARPCGHRRGKGSVSTLGTPVFPILWRGFPTSRPQMNWRP